MKALKGVLLLSALIVFGGCSEELEFQKKTRFERATKVSEIDTKSLHLYVPIVGDTLRTTKAARPHWVGQEKLVRFAFQEHALVLFEVEKDGRFKDNAANRKPIFELPVKYVDYKCTEDDYGKCTNKEELDEDTHWSKRKFFVPDFDNIEIKEVNFLPLSLAKIFGSCISHKGQSALDYEIGSDGVVIKLDVTSTNRCPGFLTELEQLSDLTFKTQYTYNILKLSSLASPTCDHENTSKDELVPGCYSVVKYPHSKDEGTFGFFDLEKKELDVDNNDTQESVYHLITRFNPKKKVIPYYLSDGFYKPENKAIKDATYEAIDRINKSLVESGTEMQIQLVEEKGINPGDIRKNMIIMVEDPVAAGLLGYGPSIPNPVTGEILHARNVMYLGTLKKFTKRTYEFLRQEREAANGPLTSQDEVVDLAEDFTGTLFEEITGLLPSASGQSPALKIDLPNLQSQVNTKGFSASAEEIIREVHSHKSHDLVNHFPDLTGEEWAQIYGVDPAMIGPDFKLSFFKRTQAYAEANAFPVEMFNFQDSVGKAIKDAFGPDEKLKPWANMSADEKQVVLDKLLPYTWIAVFVHEMGHNLGLRHNFEASEDKDNYYTREELAEMGVNYQLPYSSVMDYSYSSLNDLPVMGKYDVAALQFGYARKVDLVDGTKLSLTVEVEKEETGKAHIQELTLADLPEELPLKEYGYCTDEHVGANPGCNRFDEGTTLTEMAKHMVKAYEVFYPIRNTRQGARKYSLLGEPSYILRKADMMMGLRRFFELRERIQQEFGITDEMYKNPPQELKELLTDIDQSALVAGNFFLDLIKKPDQTCLMINQDNPSEIVAVYPLSLVQGSPLNCAGLSGTINGKRVFAGAEGGRSFKTKKSRDNPDPSVDEIDVRGIWMDKILASHFLFSRNVGSTIFDRHATLMISHPELLPKAISTVGNLLFDSFVETVPFRINETQSIPVRMQYSFGGDSAVINNNTHVIKAPLLRVVSRMLGVPRIGETLYSRRILQTLASSVPSVTDIGANDLLRQFSVYRTLEDIAGNRRPASGPLSKYEVNFGDTTYYATDETVAAKTAIQLVNSSRVMNAVGRDRVLEILTHKTQTGSFPPLNTPEENLLKSLIENDKAIVEGFLSGQIKSEVFYESLLSQLLNAANYR